jgi:hypothetical protein
MEKVPYINSIFEGKEKHTLLLQDLLRYSLVINELPLKQSNRFKLQEILNWIVRNNKEIRDYYNYNYKRRHTPYNTRVRNYREVIEPRFQILLQLNLIREAGTEKAEKLNMQVPVYEYTTYGIILALLIKGLDLEKVITITKPKDKISELKKELQKIHQDIYEVYALAFKIRKDSPAEVIFYCTLFRNLKEKGIFDKLVERMHQIMNLDKNIVNMRDLLHRVVYSAFFYTQLEQIF